jgi:hypothetical protein
MMIDDPSGQYLLQAVRRRPPVSSTPVGFPTKRMRMIVEMQTILRGAGFTDRLTIMFKDIVVADVSPPRVGIVVNVVDAEPVVDPTRTGGISDLASK